MSIYNIVCTKVYINRNYMCKHLCVALICLINMNVSIIELIYVTQYYLMEMRVGSNQAFMFKVDMIVLTVSCVLWVGPRHGVNSILSVPIPLNSIWSIPIPIPHQIDQFQFNSNSKFTNFNCIFIDSFFCPILLLWVGTSRPTWNTYSE